MIGKEPTRDELREWFGSGAWDDMSDERVHDIAELFRQSRFEDLWQAAEERIATALALCRESDGSLREAHLVQLVEYIRVALAGKEAQ